MTAAQIKRLRLKLRLTQGEFARRLGVCRRTAQGWEAVTNSHYPSYLALAALLKLEKSYEKNSSLPNPRVV